MQCEAGECGVLRYTTMSPWAPSLVGSARRSAPCLTWSPASSTQPPASLTSTDHCNSNSLRTRGGFFYHFTVSMHCSVWREEGGDRICVECRYIWKGGFRHQSCRGDGKSTNFYSLLQFLRRPAVAVSDEWWWWWHVTRDTWHWIMTRVPAARGHPCTQHCHHE